jgi:hypothetical protein
MFFVPIVEHSAQKRHVTQGTEPADKRIGPEALFTYSFFRHKPESLIYALKTKLSNAVPSAEKLGFSADSAALLRIGLMAGVTDFCVNRQVAAYKLFFAAMTCYQWLFGVIWLTGLKRRI